MNAREPQSIQDAGDTVTPLLRRGITRRHLLQTTAAAVAVAGIHGLPLGSASAQSSIQQIKIALGADTTVMDPDFDQGLEEMYRLIFNSPVTMDDNLEPVADLATSWEYTDDTTLVLHLNQAAVWQDGTPLTSDDFVFTWTRMKDPNRASTNYPQFKPWIADVVAVDPYTVQIKTLLAYAPAFDDLQGFYVAPRHYIESVGDSEFGLKPLGSGPYKVTEWQKDQFLDLDASENWWGGTPQPFPQVRFVIIPDTFTRSASLLSGDVHVVADLPVSMVPQVQSSGSAFVSITPDLAIQFIQFPNVISRKADTPEIDNKLVRQALNYAIDRETIASAVGQGYFDVVPGPWPNSSWAYPDNAADLGYHYDPDKAKALLAEAGYTDGFTFYFGTSNGFSLMDSQLMQACVPYFEAVGLKVEFTSEEWAAFDPARDDNEFSAYYLGLQGAYDPYASPSQYMTSRGRTRGFYDTDPDLEQVIWHGAEIIDFEERKAYYHETVYPKTLDSAPWIFLWTPSVILGIDNKITYTQGPKSFVEVMKMTLA